MNSFALKRISGLKHISEIYYTLYQNAQPISFIAALTLFPLVVIVAVTFGRSTQQDADPSLESPESSQHK
jgi:hypothetical protein